MKSFSPVLLLHKISGSFNVSTVSITNRSRLRSSNSEQLIVSHPSTSLRSAGGPSQLLLPIRGTVYLHSSSQHRRSRFSVSVLTPSFSGAPILTLSDRRSELKSNQSNFIMKCDKRTQNTVRVQWEWQCSLLLSPTSNYRAPVLFRPL